MKFWIGIAVVLACSFWTIQSLLGSTYFPMHDDTQVARVVVMGRALRQGQFPVRWVSGLGYGYGYPIYNFYGPLPYYAGGALYAMGVDSVIATKIMFGIGILLAAVFCFMLLESVIGISGALIGSIVFVYAPYHAVQIYIRGAVGEYWAIAFVPLVIFGLLRSLQKRWNSVALITGGLGLAGVITSHTILGFLSVTFCLVGIGAYGLITRRNIKNLLSIVVLGLGISTFFWLPAIGEMKYTGVSAMIAGAPTVLSDHFVCLNQLWNSPWGYGGSAAGCASDGMSFKLGKFQLLMAILGIIAWLRKKSPHTTVAVLLFGVSVLGMLEISKSIWSALPFVTFVQYPWRLLAFSILAMGILSGFVVTFFQKKIVRVFVTIIIISSCIAINAKLFRPQYQYVRNSKEFESEAEIQYKISKISDEYLVSDIVRPKGLNELKNVLVNGKTVSEQIIEKSDVYVRAEVVSGQDQVISLNSAFFPGWRYSINGREVTPVIAHGLPTMIVSEGKSLIEMKLYNTSVKNWGNMISLLTVIVVFGVYFYDKKTYA